MKVKNLLDILLKHSVDSEIIFCLRLLMSQG